MMYIALPDSGVRRLSFYLAMEEYIARHLSKMAHGEEGKDGAGGRDADCFFLWQVEPSVIFGRNQQLAREVNVDYCREHGIRIYRRKSGGGCVYADRDNLMLSFVTAEPNVGFAFNRFINMVLLVLRRLGIEAVGTSRNDVLIGDRKVSGTASYHLPEANIVHGTLLYDTNMTHMLNAITPGTEKLQQKGIESVRQRITLLKDYTTLTMEELKVFICHTLCQERRLLTQTEVSAIEQMEHEYLKDEFIHLL